MTQIPEDVPFGRCQDCDGWHRLDLGCPVAERGTQVVVAWVVIVAAVLLGAIAVITVGGL